MTTEELNRQISEQFEQYKKPVIIGGLVFYILEIRPKNQLFDLLKGIKKIGLFRLNTNKRKITIKLCLKRTSENNC